MLDCRDFLDDLCRRLRATQDIDHLAWQYLPGHGIFAGQPLSGKPKSEPLVSAGFDVVLACVFSTFSATMRHGAVVAGDGISTGAVLYAG